MRPGLHNTDGKSSRKSKTPWGPNLSVSRFRAPTPPQASTNGRPAVADGLHPLHFRLRGRRGKALAHRASHPPRRVSHLALPSGPPRAPPPSPPVPRLALPRCFRRRALPSRGRTISLSSPTFRSVRIDLTFRVCVCRWALMWRSSRRKPRRWPPAPAPTTCFGASATW